MYILVPSNPPSNIRIESINGTAVKILWDSSTPTDQAGPITNYKVNFDLFCKTKSFLSQIMCSPQSIDTIDHSSTSYVLTHLDGHTNYSCSISACTSSGCSPFSEPTNFLTGESGMSEMLFVRDKTARWAFLVPSKPTEVFFPEVDHWSAKMIWQPPVKLNGILTGYKLVYWRSDDEQTRIEINNLTETTNFYLAESM